MAPRLSNLRLSGSFKLILAVWRLQADAEQDFGKAVLHILKEQFPDQEINSSASEIGRKMMMIAQRQLQKSPEDAQDSIMDFLTYLTTGSQYIKEIDPETGEEHMVERTEANPWNFAKDFDDPNDALKALYTNLKRRSIDKSKQKKRKQDKERTIDDAFGSRNEDGEAGGGEGKMPTPDDSALGQALDDKAAVKEFINVIDKHVGDLREGLPLEQQVLFDLVFEDGEGAFGSDVKANMGQATALKEKLTADDASPEMQELYEKNEKRWSGFVGDTRKKLLESIRNFIENELPQADVDILWDEFFSDTTPQSVARKEQDEIKEKEQYQLDIDKRKLGRLKWKKENDQALSDKEQKDFDRLSDKLSKAGVDPESVESLNPEAKGKKLKQKAASVFQIAAIVASDFSLQQTKAWADLRSLATLNEVKEMVRQDELAENYD